MKIGFALEYSLGHITHAQNLKRFLLSDPSVEPIYIDIPFDSAPMPPILRPVFKDNWSVRASMAARSGLRPHASTLSSCLFHTQVTSLFSAAFMRKVPSVVSLDATPVQYDSLGAFYKHIPGPAPLERVKRRMNETAYGAAMHLVTWSQWAKDSLARDYGVPPGKVTVIAPGIDLDLWMVDRSTASVLDRAPTFLFVGGDFDRKGGSTLLSAFRIVRSAVSDAKLLIVTKTLPDEFDEPGVEVFRGMAPNTPELRALYARADAFAFPTLGDCLPLAVMEALAAGLPVITSRVGALGEAVTHDECGLVVEAGSSDALAAAMMRLAKEPKTRKRMGAAAVDRAHERFDAGKNYGRLIEILKGVGSGANWADSAPKVAGGDSKV
jgi:glycosyltransferase involved in cell wall biosynthesis